MKKKVKNIIKISSLSLLGLLLIAVLVGTLFEKNARRNALEAYPPPGKMIAVGEHKLHLDCRGTAQLGAPTIVLEAGLDPMGGSILWSGLIDTIATFARVCTYDRAGIAWSEIGPQPRVADKLTEELHTLLSKSGESSPYLLVAWSMGGPYARLYAGKYPEDMAGLILVDSSHPEQFDRMPRNEGFSLPPRFILKAVRWFRQVGIMRNVMKNELDFSALAPEKQAALYEVSAGSIATVITEFTYILESLGQAAAIKSLGDLPLTVLGAVDPPDTSQLPYLSPEQIIEGQKIWFQMQTEMSELSSKGKLVPVRESGHYIHFDQPVAVVKAIHEMYEEIVKADAISKLQSLRLDPAILFLD